MTTLWLVLGYFVIVFIVMQIGIWISTHTEMFGDLESDSIVMMGVAWPLFVPILSIFALGMGLNDLVDWQKNRIETRLQRIEQEKRDAQFIQGGGRLTQDEWQMKAEQEIEQLLKE